MTPYLIKKILVAIDMSETSLNALNAAGNLAKEHEAAIKILNVVEPSFGLEPDAGSFTYYFAKTRPDILSALAMAFEQENGVQVEVSQVNGQVVASIITTAIAEQCDLIVMGTHGASGFREGFIGSNAYSVVKYSPCPVLIIPPRKKPLPFRKILFPLRPTTGALMRYDIIGQFIQENAKLDLLGLSYLRMERETTVMDRIAEKIRTYSADNNLKVSITWGRGISIADDILQYAQQTSPEIIVLSSVLDATSKSDFIGPQAQKILHCSKIPILSIKQLGVPVLV